MIRRTTHCIVCDKPIVTIREKQKYCSRACKQKAFRAEKGHGLYGDTGEVSRELPAHAIVPANAKEPLMEKDGTLLFRIWGPNTISDFQLRHMGLERTGLSFDGGAYYRRT